MKKRSLTLLEIMIGIALLSMLLSGLFQIFHNSLKKNIQAKVLKQKIVQLELFEQKMHTLLTQDHGIWIDKHPAAKLPALFFVFEPKADPDFQSDAILGMLYLNSKKELCLVNYSQDHQSRMEILLENVNNLTCQLFDPKNKAWTSEWPQEKKENPLMAKIQLTWNKKEIPFVFFLSGKEKISYKK